MSDEYTVIEYMPRENRFRVLDIAGTQNYCYEEANRMQEEAFAQSSRTIFLAVRKEIGERIKANDEVE